MPPSLYDSLLEKMNGRQYSNYFSAYCPYEEHKSPALLVYDDGLFVCLSCRRKGTHQQLERKIGKHFIPPQRVDTVSRVLPQWRRWEEKYGDLEGIVDVAHKFLTRFSQAQKYFKERKIYEYADEGVLGYLDGWITFPVFSHDHKIIDIVVRSTHRDSTVRYVVHPSNGDSVRPLYAPSWQRVNSSSVVYVVYGIIDSISLHLAGLPSVTGVTGKSLPAEILRPLNKKFIIVPDEEEEREAHRLANELGMRARVKRIDYQQFDNEKIKDPDSIRRYFGNQTLLQALA